MSDSGTGQDSFHDPKAPRIEAGKIADHTLCIHCGYDLHGHDAQGRCAECGRSVKETLKFDRRKPSDQWLPRTLSIFTPASIAWTIVSPKSDNLSSGDVFLRILAYSELAVPAILFIMMIYAIASSERTSMLTWHVAALITMFGMVISITAIPVLS